MENDFEQFKVEHVAKTEKRLFLTSVTLSVIHNIISIGLVFLSLVIFSKLSPADILLSPVIYIQLFALRIIPIFALTQLALKKKLGWSLTIIIAIYDILQKILIPWFLVRDFSVMTKDNLIFDLLIIVTLFLSVILVWQLLGKRLRIFFNVSKQRLFTSLLIGIAWFLFLTFILSPMIVDFLKTPN